MDSSWFDDAVDLAGLTPPRRGVIASSRWTASSAATSVSHQLAFLEESRTLDMQELQATSSRLRRESSRLATRAENRSNLCTSGFTSRRIDLAQRFNDLMRNSGAGSRFHLAEDESLNRDLQAIKDENVKLQAVITDVTEVNKKWQKYNNDRQIYVQRLLSTIQDQQEEMSKTIESRSFLSNESLRGSTEDSENFAEKCRLEEELAQQRRRLESLEKEHREHVAVLEFQMKAHHDDWEMERSEKQQVLKEKLAAEAKVRQLQKDVRCLKLKLREERLENANHCSCCISQASEPDALTSASKLSPCRKDHTTAHSKTYRTSVHLPCTSGHLLPRGTTLSFGDDNLVIDNEENALNNLSKNDSMEGIEQSKYSPMEDSELAAGPCIDMATVSKEDTSSTRNVRKKSYLSKSQNVSGENLQKSLTDSFFDSNKLPENFDEISHEKVKQSFSQPNLITSSTPRVSCSVLHLNPSQSSSTTSLGTESTNTESTEGGSGVTIGFTRNGLASVLSFPQTPIVKSFSLPTPNVGAPSSECQLPSSPPSSLGSSRSVTPSQTFASSAESLFQDKKSSKLSLLGAFAKSIKQSKEFFSSEQETSTETIERREQMSNQRAATWKAKYFEDGVATQTKEDLICPSCGQIFPPIQHVKFLDHFEKCQSIKN